MHFFVNHKTSSLYSSRTLKWTLSWLTLMLVYSKVLFSIVFPLSSTCIKNMYYKIQFTVVSHPTQ